jgi:hydroxymethylbilane synthase
MNPIRIGTRGSRLALWQAQHVAGLLRPLAGAGGAEIVEIQTTGDQDRDVPLSQVGSKGVFTKDVPLSQIGGEGVFTKEIQRALLAGDVDVAVHSLKDLPTVAVEGLVLAAVPVRGPTGDAFVSRRHASFDALPRGAMIATSSERRRAQALHRQPNLLLVDIRGNVETRLRKLEERNLDGLILAQAGLERLGLADAITEVLDWMLPAVGQGALGLECRADDRASVELVAQINHPPSCQAVLAERAFLRTLQGGCQVPIGAAAAVANDILTLRGVVLASDGSRRIKRTVRGSPSAAEELGCQLAMKLLDIGAAELLR